MTDLLLHSVDAPEKPNKTSHRLRELTALKKEVNLSMNRLRVTLSEPKFKMKSQIINRVESNLNY